MMVGPATAGTRDWTALWEAAADATAGHAPFGSVYTGPAWALPSPAGAADVKLWKLAVLERRPGSGAVHWGHLFLLVGDAAARLALRPEGVPSGDPGHPVPVPIPAPADVPLQVRFRPTSPERADRLREFAVELQRRAVALSVR